MLQGLESYDPVFHQAPPMRSLCIPIQLPAPLVSFLAVSLAINPDVDINKEEGRSGVEREQFDQREF